MFHGVSKHCDPKSYWFLHKMGTCPDDFWVHHRTTPYLDGLGIWSAAILSADESGQWTWTFLQSVRFHLDSSFKMCLFKSKCFPGWTTHQKFRHVRLKFFSNGSEHPAQKNESPACLSGVNGSGKTYWCLVSTEISGMLHHFWQQLSIVIPATPNPSSNPTKHSNGEKDNSWFDDFPMTFSHGNSPFFMGKKHGLWLIHETLMFHWKKKTHVIKQKKL